MNILQQLDTQFTIHLGALISGALPYSIQDLRQALGENTALSELTVDLNRFLPIRDTVQDELGFLRYLCQYIKSDRKLQKLTLFENLNSDAHTELVMAASQSATVHHLVLKYLRVPVHILNGFCLANRNVKVLEIEHVSFCTEQERTLDTQLIVSEQASTITTLDKLVLKGVEFDNCRTARKFVEEIASRPNIADLHLSVGDFIDGDGGPAERAEEKEILTRMITSLLNQSRMKSLGLDSDLDSYSTYEALSIALPVGQRTNVEELSFQFGHWEIDTELYSMAIRTISAIAKLKVLRIRVNFDVDYALDSLEERQTYHVPCHSISEAKVQLLRVIDECVTLNEVHVIDHENRVFSQEEIELLQGGRIERNMALRRFVANPTEFPARDLLALMLQLQNCPSGSFALARALPKECFVVKEAPKRTMDRISGGAAPAAKLKKKQTQT